MSAASPHSGASATRFTKMHGAGNDFVVLDLRDGQASLSAQVCRAMANRRTGVGCDQVLTIEAARSSGAVAAYRIWNADGLPARQCGNGARCVAAWLLRDGAAQAPAFSLDSPAGHHRVQVCDDGDLQVALGVPDFEPRAIPLAGYAAPREAYVARLDGSRVEFGAVSVGNPHAVIEVDDVDSAPLARLGPALQQADEFPDSANVGFAQVVDRATVRLRVYERGVGETLACGSGACAAAAVLMRRGRVDRDIAVQLPGGTLRIGWPGEGEPIIMAGPAAFVFEGEWTA